MLADQRTHEQAWMKWAVTHRTRFGYRAQRPMTTLGLYEIDWVNSKAQHLLDCSEFVTISKKMVGCKDPTGFAFDGAGNSASMFAHLPHLRGPEQSLPGTIAVFGQGGASHAAVVYEGQSSNPTFCSHGTSAGPEFVTLEAFKAEFSVVTFLNVGEL